MKKHIRVQILFGYINIEQKKKLKISLITQYKKVFDYLINQYDVKENVVTFDVYSSAIMVKKQSPGNYKSTAFLFHRSLGIFKNFVGIVQES